MCQSPRADDATPPPSAISGARLDRRVILKAAATVGALAAMPTIVPSRGAIAQEAETASGTWSAAENAFAAAAVPSEPVVFQADFAFTAIGAHWDPSVEYPVVIELSFSYDGAAFTDPVLTSAAVEDAGRPDRDGRWYADLAFADGHSWVRYRTLDADLSPIAVAGLSFTYIDASAGPYDAGFTAAAIGAEVAQPRIIRRAQWGANEAYRYDRTGEIWEQEYVPVEHVIIHHTDTPNFQDPFVAMRSIYYYHAVTRGWGDIGYNYLVDFRGNIFEGRVGGENVVGGHAYQYAYGSSGIGTIGKFTFQDTTPAAQAAIVGITAYVGRNLNPFGSKRFQQVPNLPTICAHRDVNQSTCPGDYLYDDLPTIRQAVADALNVSGSGFAVGSTVRTNVSGGNMRTQPSISASVRAVLPLGTALTITSGPTSSGGYTWYGVNGAYGSGFCASIILAGSSTTPTGGIAVGDQVEVATDVLNLRSSPSTSATIVARMPTGTRGTVTDGPRSAGGYDWFRLQTPLGTGWAASEFLREIASAPPTETPPSTTIPVGATVKVTARSLNVRESPGATEPVVATVPLGTIFTIINSSRTIGGITWVGVTSARYGSGWAAIDFLEITSDIPVANEFPVGTSVYVNTNGLNMRSGPGTDRSITATLPQGLRLTISDGALVSEGELWYGVYAPGYGGGWVPGQYLARVGTTPSPSPTPTGIPAGSTVRVINGSLNFRSGPGTSASIVNVVPQGTQFTVVSGPTQANGYAWYQVRNSAYGTGWCAGDFLQVVTLSGAAEPPAPSGLAAGSTVRVIDGSLNFRTGPSTSAAIANVVPEGTQFTVVSGPTQADGYDWYEVRNSGYGTGYCVGTFLRAV